MQGKWGADLYSPVPRPMFLVRLIIVAGQLMFDPPLESIENGVLAAFDAIVLQSADIDDITTKVHMLQCPSHTHLSKPDSNRSTLCSAISF